MAGIKGQPSGTRPADVNSPVPGQSQATSFDHFEQTQAKSTGAAAGSFDQFAATSAPNQDKGYNGPGADLLEMSANAAPAIGGTVGALVGSGASIPGMAAMGMTGAAAGSVYKDYILQSVLKRVPPQSLMQNIENAKGEAGAAGAGTLGGLGVTKGAQALAASRLGTAALDGLASVAAKPLAAVRSYADAALDEVYKPFEKILTTKITPLSAEESGNAVKQGFMQDIKAKFSGYVNAYQQLDNVAKAVPLQNIVNAEGKIVSSVQQDFAKQMLIDATDLPPGAQNVVKGFADRFKQAQTGADWSAITADLKKEASEAMADAVKYRSSAVRDRAAALSKFADNADAHMEDEIIGGLAKRVAAGIASPQEMGGFQQMMAAQQNPNVPVSPDNLVKYTKSVAQDFLKQRDSVKASYAQFRGLLEDVGDVTRINPSRLGPMQFAQAINDVSSEKLVERMFDPKNAAALRTLQRQYPQIYDNVIKNKMSDIVAKNTSVTNGINYKGVAQAIEDSPVSNLLMKPAERETMLGVVNDPRLELLNKEHSGIVDKVVTGLARMGELMRNGGKAQQSMGPAVQAVSGTTGQVAGRLSSAFLPGVSLPQNGSGQ